jgi:hypothetical protein
MVGDGGEEDAENDRQWAKEARGEHQRQDLSLVADLGEADDHGREEERFHGGAIGGRAGHEPRHGPLRPTRVQGTDAKGLAKFFNRLRHGRSQVC